MSFGTYLAVFATVVATDQFSKRWAIRMLLAASGPVDASGGFTWTLTRCRSFERLGSHRAALIWVVVGAAGGALCLATPGGDVAALGGVAAWAAAASRSWAMASRRATRAIWAWR